MTKLPRYREIAHDLRAQLAAGRFQVGDKLPSIAELQDTYDVPGLNTIRQALALLIDEGLLESVQGRGTYVTALSTPRQGRQALREDLLAMKAELTASLARIDRLLAQLDDETEAG